MVDATHGVPIPATVVSMSHRYCQIIVFFAATLSWCRIADAQTEPVFSTGVVAQLVRYDDQGADVIKGDAKSGDGQRPLFTMPLNTPPAPGQTAPGTSVDNDQPSEPDDPNTTDEEEDDENEDEDPEDVPPSISSHWYLNHRGGQRFGQPMPFTTFGYFQPINLDDGILFGQTHVILSNDGVVGGSVSAGRRWYLPEQNRVVGAALSFDATPTPFDGSGSQFVLSLESRGEQWDLSANGYLPSGPRTRLSGTPLPGEIRYSGNNIVVDLLDQSETAMSGVDVQVSRRLGNQNLWAFGGWYQFQGAGERIDGGMFGVRTFLFDSLAMNLSASKDPVFGSNVGFSATYFFGGGANGNVAPDTVRSRMAEPLNRREVVTRHQSSVVTGTEVITNGGNPVTVAHVNDAGPGGTGSFNNPFGTLNDAVGTPVDVVLVHADTVFNGEQFSTNPNQRFLGQSAVPQFLNTDQFGIMPLPAATAGVNAPVIMNAPGNAITLASGSVASGFLVQSAAGAGVFGQDANNVLVEDITVQGAVGPGLQLQVSGANVVDATVRNNIFVGNGSQSSLVFGPNAGAVLNANLDGNEDSLGFLLHRDAAGFLRLGGSIGQGGFFNDDNGNLAGNGNTTAGGAPVVNILGAGNQIEIIDPGVIVVP